MTHFGKLELLLWMKIGIGLTFLIIKYASPCEIVEMNMLHCAVSKNSLYANMRKFLDAYAALCGFSQPLMRYHAKTCNLFCTMI